MIRSEKLRQFGHVFRPGRNDDVVNVLYAWNVKEILHEMRRHLVLGYAGTQKFHALPMRGVADGPNDDAEAFLFVLAFNGPRFHYRSHTVDPSDVLFLENLNHVDVDEVNAELGWRRRGGPSLR